LANRFWYVLGRQLEQQDDLSIVCSQHEYANQVQTIPINKERRKSKQDDLTESERKRLREVIGAASWLVGNTRPNIAASTAFRQQRVQRAKVEDRMEANHLVAKMRDFKQK
jgi:hypothetical protein